jgi:hypothetical protein
MKIILTENQVEFIRRYSTLKELVENAIDVLDQYRDLCDYTLSEFLTEVCWQVSDHMDVLNMDSEALGTIEKIHRWVRNNFGDHITKEFNILIVTHDCGGNFDDSYDDEDMLEESLIKENQYSLMRRVAQAEDLIYPTMDMVYEFLTNNTLEHLNMNEYDAFIDLISIKIAYEILNKEKNLEGDEKSKLLNKISRFVKDEYWDVIRKYFNSRLSSNLNESTHDLKFKRRYEEIEDGVYDFILRHKITTMDTFDSFLIELSWDVANDVIRKINIPEDDYVMYRNQLIRFIKNNFYEELKEFWDRNTHQGKNINESQVNRMFQRRYQYISEFIDRALSRYDVCIYTDVIDFVDRVMDYTADNLYESLFKLGRDDNHSEYYQDIYDFISDHFVDRIHEFYEDSKHYCIDEDGNWIH